MALVWAVRPLAWPYVARGARLWLVVPPGPQAASGGAVAAAVAVSLQDRVVALLAVVPQGAAGVF